MKYKKNKYYYNNNIYPINQNLIKNKLASPLFEVENFLCSINKTLKFFKLIRFFKKN